jgi:endonuclease-8
MPEGHTIHRLARDLNATFAGHPVVASSPQGRFREGAAQIDRQVLEEAVAHGKHLFLRYEDSVLHIHLGLIGKFRPVESATAPGDTVRLRLEAAEGEQAWHLTGPQECQLVDDGHRLDVLDRLGPDPLRRGARPEPFVAALGRRRAPIGAALLDQAIIAGIGNVYRAELLFLAGIDPRTPSSSLTEEQGRELWGSAKAQLRQGVRLDRIVTVSKQDAGRSPGRLARGDALYVYKREGLPCRRCSTEIAIGDVGGRSCWWCPSCQR